MIEKDRYTVYRWHWAINVLLAAFLFPLSAFTIMTVWNWFVPALFGWRTISFIEAFALRIVIMALSPLIDIDSEGRVPVGLRFCRGITYYLLSLFIAAVFHLIFF